MSLRVAIVLRFAIALAVGSMLVGAACAGNSAGNSKDEDVVVTATCGGVLKRGYDYGIFSGAQVPLGTVLQRNLSGPFANHPIAIAYFHPMPQRKQYKTIDSLQYLSDLTTDVSGAVNGGLVQYSAAITAAAKKHARVWVFNASRAQFDQMDDSINGASDAARTLQQRFSGMGPTVSTIGLVSVVFYMDSVRLGVDEGKAGSVTASLGKFGHYNVTAKYSCDEFASFTGDSIPRAMKIIDIVKGSSGGLVVGPPSSSWEQDDYSDAITKGPQIGASPSAIRPK